MDGKEIIKLVKEGNYNFNRSDSTILRELLTVILYQEERIKRLEEKHTTI